MNFRNRIEDYSFRASFWETPISKAEVLQHCNAVFTHDEDYTRAKDDAFDDMEQDRRNHATRKQVQGSMRRAANRVGWDRVAEVVQELTGVCEVSKIPVAQYRDVIDAMKHLRVS